MSTQPWYRRTLRWGQTNITEIDPTRYDIAWWREYWRRTHVQGVIINAGGIVAYYPSELPLTHHAAHLAGRDLFGELVEAARQQGLTVLARMDSNRVHEPFHVEHKDWLAVQADGAPYMIGDMYVTCVDGPYYEEYLPQVLTEIATRYRPDGFTDNSYSGLESDRISYSVHSRRRFRRDTGLALPAAPDWDDPVYRQWLRWSYRRRMQIWDLNNRVTRQAGGPDCWWIGMTGGGIPDQCRRLRDYQSICERTPIIMLDSQARRGGGGFEQNGEAGKLIHGLLGWDKLIPESTAMYEHAASAFRVASKHPVEARYWALEGFAGGIQPWWHHIGAYHEDRRQYTTAEALFTWHRDNEAYLVNREPVATVGMGWSQDNVHFFGRDDAATRFSQPWAGVRGALIQGRIPYLPVHLDHVERDGGRLRVLVLANVGGMSDRQCAAVRAFVAAGGSLVTTAETSLYDEDGQRRDDFALADLLGVHHLGGFHGHHHRLTQDWSDWRQHSYLRLQPSVRKGVYGPSAGDEPEPGRRHEILAGFEQTDILPFGGRLELVAADADAAVLATMVPQFPIFPPETSWMAHPNSRLPAMVLREHPAGGRIVYFAADVDRLAGRENLSDHKRLLDNAVRWAAAGDIPLRVHGRGKLDCHLYRQDAGLILHLVNLTATAERPVTEVISVGPVTVELDAALLANPSGEVRRLVAGDRLTADRRDGVLSIRLDRIDDHEVLVVT